MLRTDTATAIGRVLIEVEDECGGLPPGRAEDLFRSFEQRSADRSGLGLGLAIARESVETNGGVIRARSLPSKGCIFTVDLPVVGSSIGRGQRRAWPTWPATRLRRRARSRRWW